MKARPRGLNEPVRNRSGTPKGKANGKSRPQKPRKRTAILDEATVISKWEQAVHLHTQYSSIVRQYRNAAWAYLEASTGFTQWDVVKFPADFEDYKIIDFVPSAPPSEDFTVVVEPMILVGAGDQAFHRTVRRRRKRIPLEKFIHYQPEMTDTIILAKPVSKK